MQRCPGADYTHERLVCVFGTQVRSALYEFVASKRIRRPSESPYVSLHERMVIHYGDSAIHVCSLVLICPNNAFKRTVRRNRLVDSTRSFLQTREGKFRTNTMQRRKEGSPAQVTQTGGGCRSSGEAPYPTLFRL